MILAYLTKSFLIKLAIISSEVILFKYIWDTDVLQRDVNIAGMENLTSKYVNLWEFLGIILPENADYWYDVCDRNLKNLATNDFLKGPRSEVLKKAEEVIRDCLPDVTDGNAQRVEKMARPLYWFNIPRIAVFATFGVVIGATAATLAVISKIAA
jgi:hypothetical protein